MEALLIAGGVLFILAAVTDLLWTTLWVDGGAGPITRLVGRSLWSLFRAIGSARHRILSAAGPTILIFTLLVWIMLLWVGWTMVFSAEGQAVVSSSSERPADLASRFYFVGYSIFTLGNGDFKPNGAAWQILTGIAAGSGLLLVTLAITYLLSVVSAVVSARAFAVQVMGLGESAEDAVIAGWDGETLGGLNWPFQSANSALSNLSQQYLAYPVLRYFHPSQASSSDVLAFRRLEDMAVIAGAGVPKNHRPDPVLLNGVQSSLNSLLTSLPSRFQETPGADPESPDLHRVQQAGIPTVAIGEFNHAQEDRAEHRRAFAALAREHGWSETGRLTSR